MLASQSFEGSASLYTVPTGKRAIVYLDIFTTSMQTITVNINEVLYWQGPVSGLISFKLTLSAGDEINVSGTGYAHVHGVLLNA